MRVAALLVSLAVGFLEHFPFRCSGRPSGRPDDGLKPVAYIQTENA